MGRRIGQVIHTKKDHEKLTAYESRVWEAYNMSEKSYRKTAELLNKNPSSIATTLRNIREKVDLQEALRNDTA